MQIDLCRLLSQFSRSRFPVAAYYTDHAVSLAEEYVLVSNTSVIDQMKSYEGEKLIRLNRMMNPRPQPPK